MNRMVEIINQIHNNNFTWLGENPSYAVEGIHLHLSLSLSIQTRRCVLLISSTQISQMKFKNIKNFELTDIYTIYSCFLFEIKQRKQLKKIKMTFKIQVNMIFVIFFLILYGKLLMKMEEQLENRRSQNDMFWEGFYAHKWK